MPQIQTVDLSPREAPPSALEKTLSSFSQRNRENQLRQQDTDALRDIYQGFQNRDQDIQNAFLKLQTNPDISPSERVNQTKNLLEMQKQNATMSKDKAAINRAAQAADAKRAEKEALDQRRQSSVYDLYRPYMSEAEARDRSMTDTEATARFNVNQIQKEAAAKEKKTQKDIEKQGKDKEAEEKKQAQQSEVKTYLMETGRYSEEQAEELSKTLSPVSARALDYNSQPKFESESDKLDAKRVADYIVNTEERAKASDADIAALTIQKDLLKQGATGMKFWNAVADVAQSYGIPGSEALRDPASKAFDSSVKQMISGFGDIVKGKVSNFEFTTLKSMLAQAADSPEAAGAMIEVQSMNRRIAVEENKIMQQVLQEYEAAGKPRPRNLMHVVNERLRPISNQIVTETSQNIRKILYPETRSTNKDKARMKEIDKSLGSGK